MGARVRALKIQVIVAVVELCAFDKFDLGVNSNAETDWGIRMASLTLCQSTLGVDL